MAEADPLEVAAWQMATGSLASEDLPDIATDALVRGVDTPALRMLAGQPRDAVRDSADLFQTALGELGIAIPDADSAHWRLARRTAIGIVTGRISPGHGATDLWLAYLRVRDNADLRIFVGLASVLDDCPEDADQLATQIITEAQALLDRPEPRRWIKLMAVRGRSPLTQPAGEYDTEVAIEDLQASEGLHDDLVRWDAQFAQALDGWPDSGGFEAVAEVEAFVAAGERLVSRLQHELGPTYHVEYMPEPIRPPGVKLRVRPIF